jgi:hypothetical protein
LAGKALKSREDVKAKLVSLLEIKKVANTMAHGIRGFTKYPCETNTLEAIKPNIPERSMAPIRVNKMGNFGVFILSGVIKVLIDC